MPLIEWKTVYSVGVRAMDDQHKKLIDLINQLHEAMKQGKGSKEIGTILKGLADYTVFHFGSEEQLLTKNNYPGLVAHQAIHKEFVDKLHQFQKDATTSNFATSIKVRDFLQDWLIGHICGDDQKYMKFLNDKGIH